MYNVGLQAHLFSSDYNFLRKRSYFNYLLNTESSDMISTFIFWENWTKLNSLTGNHLQWIMWVLFDSAKYKMVKNRLLFLVYMLVRVCVYVCVLLKNFIFYIECCKWIKKYWHKHEPSKRIHGQLHPFFQFFYRPLITLVCIKAKWLPMMNVNLNKEVHSGKLKLPETEFTQE